MYNCTRHGIISTECSVISRNERFTGVVDGLFVIYKSQSSAVRGEAHGTVFGLAGLAWQYPNAGCGSAQLNRPELNNSGDAKSVGESIGELHIDVGPGYQA